VPGGLVRRMRLAGMRGGVRRVVEAQAFGWGCMHPGCARRSCGLFHGLQAGECRSREDKEAKVQLALSVAESDSAKAR